MGHEHTGQNDAGDGHGRYGMGEQKNGRQAAGGAHVPRVGGRAGADGRDAALARAGPPVAAEPPGGAATKNCCTFTTVARGRERWPWRRRGVAELRSTATKRPTGRVRA